MNSHTTHQFREILASLRCRMLDVAGIARDQHIDKQMDAYEVSRAEAESILDQLRELYRLDVSPFDEEFLADIRAAKLSARIIIRAELDREAVERERRCIVTAHAAFLQSRGLPNRGTRLGLGKRRVTHCYNCKQYLDNAVDVGRVCSVRLDRLSVWSLWLRLLGC